jgi:hypothetical protein
MFSTVLQELKGYFGREFLIGAFFPLWLFVSLSAAIALEITIGLSNALAQFEKLSGLTQALLLVGGLIAITALAYLVQNFQYSIVRLFEGYGWKVPPLSWMRKRRVDYHKARAKFLDDHMQEALLAGDDDTLRERAFELATFYPPRVQHPDLFMPTQIGNILRASEVYALDRYGLDSVIIWSRLRPVLKTEALAPLDEKRLMLDSLLLMTFLAALFASFWCVVLAIFTPRWELFVLSALGLPLAWLCYKNAVQSAIAYGEQIKATFDVYRGELLKAVDKEMPAALKDEKMVWDKLTRFFYYNETDDSEFFNPPPAGTKAWDRVANALAEFLETTNVSRRTPWQEEQQ